MNVRTAAISGIAGSAIVLAACVSDPGNLIQFEEGTTLNAPTSGDHAHAAHALSCTITVRPGASFSCQPVGGSTQPGEAAVIVGGQGTYVELAADSVVRAGDIVTLHGVTVTNLMVQRLGTANGLPVEEAGIRVFFAQLPDNQVEVANHDGTDTFLQAAQPYYLYPDTLMPGGTSSPKDWEFDMSASTEDAFTFGVLVHAAIPNEQGALLIDEVQIGTESWHSVWAVSSDFVIAVGGNRSYAIYDGDSWSGPHTITAATAGASLFSVWASGPDNIWTVGNNGPTFLHYDGQEWTNHTDGVDPGEDWYSRGVWGTAGGDTVFAVSVQFYGQPGRAYRTVRDGNGEWSAWQLIGNLDGTPNAVHGTSASDVWVPLQEQVVHWNGSAFEAHGMNTSGVNFVDIWATSEDEVWTVGNGAIFRMTDTDGWQDLGEVGQPFESLASGSHLTVWVPVSDFAWIGRSPFSPQLQLLHFDGDQAFGILDGGEVITEIHGPSPDEFWATGADGLILHGHR